jgi:tRNA A-37 threonylcarbamoyl transferase component Bud32
MGVRLRALADATASVMTFLAYLPSNLSTWLDQQPAAGREAIESACRMVVHGLKVDVPLMNSRGLLHGDAHHDNILTDGNRLYFAALGLATFARSRWGEHCTG